MADYSPDLPSKKRIFCNRCKNETNHILKSDHDRRFYEEENGQLLYWEEEVSRFWVCAGCDEGLLEVCYTMSGMIDEKGNQRYSSTYYPKRKQDIIPSKIFLKLPPKLKDLHKETISAYNDGLHLLCASGLRTLLEGICVDKNITGKTLENKIDKLNSMLPANIVSNLHSFRFMGNVAVHELEAPKRTDLCLAIEVSEDLLNFLYELDYKTSLLNKITTGPKKPQKIIIKQ